MDAALHRIEALAGDGRYSLTFRRADGGEQSAVVEIAADDLAVAPASLPVGWSVESDAFAAAARAVHALHESRRQSSGGATLRDVEGGWDVGLGNVVLGADGVPECSGHGPMSEAAGLWTCVECGARALVG